RQGTPSATSSSSDPFVGANFTIDPKAVTVTADAGQHKTYGDSDPALTYSGTLLAGDSFSGSLTRVAGEGAGSYAIGQGTLSAGSNYAITFVGANFTIDPKAVTVTADAGQHKTYGDSDPALSPNATLLAADSFSGSLTRV